MSTRRLWLFLLASVYAALGQSASSQPVRLVPTGPSAELAAEIEHASADSAYAVELGFAARSSVGDIRTVAMDLGIPRILAFVEHAVGGRPAGIFVLGLGRMYADDAAREYSECRALLAARMTASELGDVRIDEWPVSRIHVFATAHTVRELLRETRLPAATIVSGYVQPRHVGVVERTVREESSQPLAKPNNVDLPPYCSKFVGQPAEPTLSRDFPRGFQPPAALPGESFRDTASRVLAALPPNSAVSIDLKLQVPGDLELLTELVRDYDIPGMRAELVPVRSGQRMAADVQLSNHGGMLPSLLHRVQCQLRSAEETHAVSGGWRSDWISVSLSAASAARFLSYPNLAQATVGGGHPLAALDRLAGYYERLTTTVYEWPRSMPIPAGCGNVYVHGDLDELGSMRAVPFGHVSGAVE